MSARGRFEADATTPGTAEWHLGQSGRLGVVPKRQGYKPSPAGVQQFQAALQNELMRMGC